MLLLASSGFVTICPKKEVELGADKLLHRADHAEELRAEISFECPKATGNQYAYLPGGAVRAINPNSSMTLAETDNLIAVFKGNLTNKAELALQLLGCPKQLSEASLLLRLYDTMGLDMLGKLAGQYAFCLYDIKQARVLAARDPSGAVPLLEGRTAAGSLIIACGTFLPEGTTQMVEIKPGEYKYGWHALPRAFKSGDSRIVAGRASCDYGIRRRSIDAYNQAPNRRSVDLPRHNSMDIPRRNAHATASHSNSHSYSHAPGRYMPPHIAAAAAAGGGGFNRQRATSLDGGHAQGPQQQYHHGTPPASGRRRSETNNHSNKHHNWTPKAPATAGFAAPAAAAAAAPATPKAAVVPAPIQTPSACLPTGAEEANTPSSAASTPSTQSSEQPHRRKRRHHRRPKKDAGAAAAPAAADDGHASDADSQVSSSTHDSAGSGAAKSGTATAAATPASVNTGKPQHSRCTGKNSAAIAAAAAAGAAAGRAAAAAYQSKQQEQRRSSSGSSSSGFKRNGSCGELAALAGTSPSAHSVLLAAPQGLAC